ncbi:PorP/SprF family type IX secretion system membrane protein [Paracrocinitomix mangrovi]|uniref:PorP/SprF family type IX secretion system membrane protein n=1 Tax=Paracrocinitomix mangrovi TaxID=2862509 RepID=UPI001C8E33F3|nr:PorP/SprF family type IX secretion system membrane protein [Paracrocinitomix mangrovi]UKN02040.1 PorP/SprF family type IX secretion system membrane protein [Paracrocinitomix mangrovi]
MKHTLPLLVFLLFGQLSFGQQDKQLTHYIFDKMSYNPAATGFNGFCGTFIYRNQWDRVQDAPNTTLINIQGNIPQQGFGVGMSFTNDAIGFQRNNTLTLNGAFHLKTPAGVLSSGIGLGIINVAFSPNWIPPQTPYDPVLPGSVAGTGFDMNLGLYWHGNRPYYVGISTTHVAPANLTNINFNIARHYYVLAGYNYALNTDRKIDLKPSVLIKADGATMVFDVNVMGDFWLNTHSYLWGGLSYRMADAVAISAGFAISPRRNVKVNMMKFGYSFDIMTNPLNTYGKGTHELMFNFCIFPPPKGFGRHGNPFVLE